MPIYKPNTNLQIANNSHVPFRAKRAAACLGFSHAGFTLIELLTVVSIIFILSSVVFADWRFGEKDLELQRAAHQLSQDLAKAREMALSAEEVNCGGSSKSNNFGIHFESSWPDHYILFADCNGNHQWESGTDVLLETVYLKKSIEISSLSPASSFSIVFIPPDPIVYINTQSSSTLSVVTLSNGRRNREVKTNTTGMIEID